MIFVLFLCHCFSSIVDHYVDHVVRAGELDCVTRMQSMTGRHNWDEKPSIRTSEIWMIRVVFRRPSCSLPSDLLARGIKEVEQL